MVNAAGLVKIDGRYYNPNYIQSIERYDKNTTNITMAGENKNHKVDNIEFDKVANAVVKAQNTGEIVEIKKQTPPEIDGFNIVI